ncbi:MAG: bifunctional nicotinamidase/pyrazinamidase [Pseudomonadota bacterium]
MADDREALVVIDVQNDFCSDGALEVPDGDAVVEVINELIQTFPRRVFTQDWHPAAHQSFASSHPGTSAFDVIEVSYGPQVLWPDHCVQGTPGAEFHRDLAVDGAELIIRKGFRLEIDSYSAFFENDRTTPTGLAGYLRERGIDSLYLAGLATDFCVAYSAVDAAHAGFRVTVIEDACRAIDMDDSLARAWNEMHAAGVSRSLMAAL